MSKHGLTMTCATLAITAALFGGTQYAVTWTTADSGGPAVGGNYQLHSALGQPDAGSSSGGIYSVTGGFIPQAPTASPVCPGDTNGDSTVDFTDLNAILSNWNMTVAPSTMGDTNGDGTVDFTDLNEVLSNWNTAC